MTRRLACAGGLYEMFDFATRMRPGQEAELGRRLAQALRPTQQPNLWVLFASNTQVKEMEVKVQANPYGAHVAWARINELLDANFNFVFFDTPGTQTSNLLPLALSTCTLAVLVAEPHSEYTNVEMLTTADKCRQVKAVHNRALEVALVLNIILLGLYIIEIIIKVISTLPNVRLYLSDYGNVFDLAVVLASLVDIILASGGGKSGLQALRVLRIVRVFRTLRFVRRSPRLMVMVQTMVASVPGIIAVMGFLTLHIFIFAILGNQFFSALKFGTGLNRRNNFDSPWDSMLTLFVVVTGDGLCSGGCSCQACAVAAESAPAARRSSPSDLDNWESSRWTPHRSSWRQLGTWPTCLLGSA